MPVYRRLNRTLSALKRAPVIRLVVMPIWTSTDAFVPSGDTSTATALTSPPPESSIWPVNWKFEPATVVTSSPTAGVEVSPKIRIWS